MSIRSSDGKNFRRIARTTGDRIPATGIKRTKAFYSAVGGETSLDLQSLSPQISYQPGLGQIEVKSSAGPMIEGLDYYETSGTSISFPNALLANEKLEIIQTFQYSGNLVAQIRPDEFSQIATVSQTNVAADFSWKLNQNPSKRHGAVKVYLNGQLQQRGNDYNEVDLTTANTNQINFIVPLIGGENISIFPSYQAIDEAAASTQFNNTRVTDLQSNMTAGFQGMVDETSLITVPGTAIQNRAKVPDLANNLEVSFGNKRIMTQSIYEIQNESGASGEKVYGAVNDDRGLIRFVGVSGTSNNDASGQFIVIASGNYVEITFYGTGLNLITSVWSQSATLIANLNGGSDSANLWTGGTSYSSIIANRNYSANNIINVYSGLSLGLYTVKIRSTLGSIGIYGFEILNTSSTTSLAINPGTAYVNGRKLSLLNSSLSSYNSGFTNVYGTAASPLRGGRVLTYLASDGTVKKDFQYTNTAQANTTSADHTNEEVIRTYYWREFGAGRADDFSTYISGISSRAFTLDDGTTTLVVNNILQTDSNGGFTPDNTGSTFALLTFVGTGLDIMTGVAWGSGSVTVLVDNSSIGTISAPAALTKVKIVSGLPYGTHTVKLSPPGGMGSPYMSIKQFIVYGPKKPAVPSGAFELADYNVMATYVAASGDQTSVSTGVLLKASVRELLYIGSWNSVTLSTFYPSTGLFVGGSINGDSWQYTFFGTGFEHLVTQAAAAASMTITIDGALYTGSATFSSTGGGTNTWTPGTSTWVQGLTTIGLIQITGLTLGLHTAKFIRTSAAGAPLPVDFRVITPIHSQKSNLYADYQNTLPVGSCSLSDNRKTSLIKESLPATKSRVIATTVSGTVTSSVTSLVPLPDMSATIKTQSGFLDITGEIQWRCTAGATGNGATFAIFVDGVNVESKTQEGTGATIYFVTPIFASVPVGAGVHKVDIYWQAGSGVTMGSLSRTMVVKEV